MTKRTFYKTRYVVEVLSEDPIPNGLDLAEVMKEATYGSYSMQIVEQKDTTLNGQEAADALLNQGSSTDFFSLDEEGNDVDDDDSDDE